MEKTDQVVDFGEVPKLWPQIEQWCDRAESAEDEAKRSNGLTARRFDESQTSGHRGYIAAHRLLMMARENHNAFLEFVNAVGFWPTSPFNLLRPVLEGALWTLWLLDPSDGRERRYRGLWFEIQDFRQEAAYLDELGRMSDARWARDSAAERKAQVVPIYHKEAEAFDTTYAELRRRDINLTDNIAKLNSLKSRYDNDMLRFFVSEWRRLSGYQHGKAWSTALGADQTVIAKIPGGQKVHMTPSDHGIQLATTAAGLCLLEAARLLVKRTTEPAT